MSLTAEVANVYVIVRTFEQRLRLAGDNAAIQERSLQIANVRFDNGLTTELDVEQARTLLANTRALIPQLRVGLRQAEHALSILLGLPPTQGSLTGVRPGLIPTPPAELRIGIPAELLRRRPDIQRAEFQAAAQSALIGIAQTDLYPRFTLTGTLGLRSSDTQSAELGDLLDIDSLQSGIGPSFSWNILNYARIKNAVRVEDARLQQALVNYRSTVLAAAREVEDATVAFVRGKERVALLQDSVDAAQRAVELALVQYRDGAVDYTRVLDTQEFLVAQQDNHTAARGEVVRSLIATYKALGGGWPAGAETGFLPASVRQEMAARTDWGNLLETRRDAPPTPVLGQPDW